MTYNKPMFTIDRTSLSPTQQQPKRLPRGSSPSGSFAAMLNEQSTGEAKTTEAASAIPVNMTTPNFTASFNGDLTANTNSKPGSSRGLLNEINARHKQAQAAQAIKRSAGGDNAQSLATLAKVMQNNPTPLKTLDTLLSNPELASQIGIEGGEEELQKLKDSPFMASFHKLFKEMRAEEGAMSIRTNGHRRKENKVSTIGSALKDMFKEQYSFSRKGNDFIEQLRKASKNGLGYLAAQFESGRDGIAAIGYDRAGGTSYGKYQIASRVGSMDAFIDYLDSAAPDVAKQLKAAGPADTGGRNGKMPEVWRKIANEQPERFEELQESFIQASHYLPALGAISRATGIDPADMPSAMHEVIFSTAVQHGPGGASKIFNRAFSQTAENFGNKQRSDVNVATSKALGEALIKNVYDIRSGQFSGSSASVRGAVQNRLKTEMHMAITMLRENIV